MQRRACFIVGGITGVVILTAIIVTVLVLVEKIEENTNSNGCSIYPFEHAWSPFVVISGTSDFLYPLPGENVLRFDYHQSVDILCPGRNVLLNNINSNQSVLSGYCLENNTFVINNAQIDWPNMDCSNYPWRTARYTGATCENNGLDIEIGFDTGDNRFLRSMSICFDPVLQVAHYTFINQTASINQRALNTPRPSWLQGSEFYDIGTVTNLYKRANQRRTINSLIGLNETSTLFIEDDTNYFLSRGHQTAGSDGFYPAQQNATFFMMNIAPQWQTFNGFNWNQIEIDVRDYAEDNSVDLWVWTGVYGVATLPHQGTGDPVELYLYVNSTENRKALPVPEVYWKVAYNPITERGVALIGVNNPYYQTYTPLCNDISDQLTWLKTNNSDQEQGFCYACSVDTFRRVVTSMPNISVSGILL